MYRTVWLLTLLVTGSFTLLAARVGRVQEPAPVEALEPEHAGVSTPAAPRDAPSEAPSEPAQEPHPHAEGILEIRAKLGGSILEGTSLGRPQGNPRLSDALFLEALETQLRENQQRQHEPPSRESIRLDLPLEEITAEELTTEEIPNRLPQLPTRVNTARLPAMSSGPTAPDLAAVLRTAGRHLDQHANDLEELGDYARGDEMRMLAERIRHVARDVRVTPPNGRSR